VNGRPFWEDSFADLDAPSPFGDVSAEIVELCTRLPKGARTLDLGAGDGRNALFLGRQGFTVTAVDISAAGITKLQHLANQQHLSIRAVIEDLRTYEIKRQLRTRDCAWMSPFAGAPTLAPTAEANERSH